MAMLDANIAISPELTNVITTKAAIPSELANEEEAVASARAIWDDLIDNKLIEWGRNPSALEDDDFVSPTSEVINEACALALEMRNANCPPPLRICPDGDGGICFERKVGKWFESLELSVDGKVELSTFYDCNLVRRQRLN